MPCLASHTVSVHSERGYDDETFESEWGPITEKPEEEARAMMDSREPTMELELTPHPPTEHKSHGSTDQTDLVNPSQLTDLSPPSAPTDPSRESTETSVTKTKSKSSKTRSARTSTPSAGDTVLNERTTEKTRMSERSRSGDFKKKRSEERSRSNTVKSSRKESDAADDEVFDKDNTASTASDAHQRKSSSLERTPRSLGTSDMKRKESKSRNRTPVSGGRSDLTRNRGSSRNSVHSRSRSNDLSETTEQKPKNGLKESRAASSRQESVKSVTSEEVVNSKMNRPASSGAVAEECLLPNINAPQRSLSVVSGRTSPVFEELPIPGWTSHRSQSQLTDRSRLSDGRKNVTHVMEAPSSSQDVNTEDNLLSLKGHNSPATSLKSADPKNGCDLIEKLPPLNLSGLESPPVDLVSTSLAEDKVVSGGDDTDGQEDGKAPSHCQSMSRPQSQATEINSRILSGESHPSGPLQVTGEQVFVPSVPHSPLTRSRSLRSLRSSRSTVSRIDEG